MTTITLTADEVAELEAGILHRIRLHGFCYGHNPDKSYKPHPACGAILKKLAAGKQEPAIAEGKTFAPVSGSNF